MAKEKKRPRPSATKSSLAICFETAGTNSYPTDAGQQLQIAEGIIAAQMSLRFEWRSPSDDLPTDALACDLLTADSEGRIWSATSRFTTELLVTQ